VTLERTVARGVTVVGSGRLLGQLVQLGVSIWLMRVLPPEDFGLIAMVLVFSGFAAALSNVGFAEALVQHSAPSGAHKDTAFFMNSVVGLVLTLLLFLAAPLIASFYSEEILTSVARTLSPILLLGSLAAVPMALLQREHRFGRMALAELCGILVGGAAGIWSASSGLGVWSLVWMQISVAGVTFLSAMILGSWHPTLEIRSGVASELVRFGWGLTGFNTLNFWARQADNLLIGRFMGSNALGLYSRAYSLMVVPLTQLVPTVSRVMFPVLSEIRDDHLEARQAYLKVVGVLATITFPIMLGMLATARPLVEVLFGPDWLGAVSLIRILAVVGAIQIILNPTGWIYLSQGRTDLLFRWGLFSSTFLILAIITGVVLGSAESVAWCYLAANLILAYPCLSWAGRLVGLAPTEVVGRVGFPFSVAAVMCVLVALLGYLLPNSVALHSRLIIQVISGILLYLGPLVLYRPLAVRDLLGFLSSVSREEPTLRRPTGAGALE